jgi:S1-C subfamily serine protease
MTQQSTPPPTGQPVYPVPPEAAASAPATPPAGWVPPPPASDQIGTDAWGGAPWGGSPWYPPPWSAWPPPPPPSRRPGRTIAAVAVIVAAGVVAGSVAVVLATRSSSPSEISGVPGNLAPLPTVPPASSGQGSASLDPTAIAARVDPAVVDINVTLGGQGAAAGTGIILTSSGEVLTNNHVVEGATGISVQVNGSGPQYQATVIGVDPTDDVALVQMTGASGLPTAPLGNSSSVAVGDQIVALGNALGSGGAPSPTPGVVTALDQTITASDAGGVNAETLTGMIEVRAGIQPGDSGGPMADSSGHVIAMTTAGSARVRRTGTIGFGIPINKALTIAQQIQSGSGPNVQAGQRGILGVQIDTTATGASGAVVAQVEPGSPAEGAGITGGDVITGIDATSIGSADALRTALQGRKPGDTVTVHWTDQSGQQHSARVALVAGPPA